MLVLVAVVLIVSLGLGGNYVVQVGSEVVKRIAEFIRKRNT